MAKYEKQLKGDFDVLKTYVNDSIIDGSVSSTYEDGFDGTCDGIRCCTMVYERYSAFGGNRVSMNVTIFGKDDNLNLVAITSGGSQAVFWKINTLGEETFLDTLIRAVEEYERKV